MAQRPQPLVRESIVISGLLFGRQPHAAQLVGRLLRRHGHAGMLVHHLAIGGAATVCNPRARAARMIGSIAVTRPLAGRHSAMLSPWRTWMYGSRLDTTITSCPGRSVRRMARSVSGVHAS